MVTTGFLVILLFVLRLGVPVVLMLLLGQALLRRHS